MAYTLFRRTARCFECRRKDVALFTVHGSGGQCVGILCRKHAGPWLLCHGVTASPLGNLRRHKSRRRHVHPARG